MDQFHQRSIGLGAGKLIARPVLRFHSLIPRKPEETAMRIALDINRQSQLLNAFGSLDSYEAITPGIEQGAKVIRVPYKLGCARRELIKNINALKASLLSFEEVRKSMIVETWPDKPEYLIDGVPESEQKYPLFKLTVEAVVARKDDVELLPMPAAVMYGNDFPSGSVALLDELGLISEAAA
jgi:hypothetical protein